MRPPCPRFAVLLCALLSLVPFAPALRAATLPVTLIDHADPAAQRYVFVFVDPNKIRNETVEQAKLNTAALLAPLGLKPVFPFSEFNAAGLSAGAAHFGTFDVWTYNRETFLPSLAGPPANLTFDRGVKQTYTANFRTPVLVGDPPQLAPVMHVHFDVPMSQFGFHVQTTAAAGTALLADSLRFTAYSDVDFDGVPDTLVGTTPMTLGVLVFFGGSVPSGFTDCTIEAVGGGAQAWVADEFDYLERGATLGVGGAPTPPAFTLGPAAPSPSRGPVSLRFELPAPGRVTAEVFAVDGRRVRTLLDGSRAAGAYDLAWDGRDADGTSAGAGVYFARLSFGGRTLTRRIVRVP